MTEAPDILSPEYDANPYPFYEVLRDEYPVMWHEGTQAYVISRYEDVAGAFRNPQISSRNYEWQTEPVHGRTILQMEGKEHSSYRGIVNPIFRGSYLEQSIVPAITKAARQQIGEFLADGEVDLCKRFSTYYPIGVIVQLLDLPMEDVPQFYEWYTMIMDFVSNITGDEEKNRRGMAARAEMGEYLMPKIAERRANPGDDLLTAMVTKEFDGVQMSDDDIRGFCSLLLTAGGETTEKAITLTMRNLLDNPEQMAEVRADRQLIGPAFAETLRFTGPVQMIMRHTDEEVEFSGGAVEAGHTLELLLGAANRDPEAFDEPDRFNIHRTDMEFEKAFSAAADHTAFALGRHFCVGSMLARAELTVAMDALLDAMDDIAYADGYEQVETGVYTRGLTSLPLTFTPNPDFVAG